MRVAREVAELEETAAAWAAGDITTKHAEAIARARHAAKADEKFDEFEPALANLARNGTPEDVANTAQQWRDALDADLNRDGSDNLAEQQHARRGFDFSRSIHGMGFGSLTVDPVDSEFIETALHRAYEELHVAGDKRTPSQQRADALVEICRVYLDKKTNASRTNLPSVLVIQDAPTAAGEAVGECRLASGYRISPKTAARLACHANHQDIYLDNGVPLAMGRTVRTFTPDQFRAMVVRDAHCRGPGCTVDPAHCEAHHLDEWERDDGPTDLDNGALFCRGNCHRKLHEGGWTVAGDPNGQLKFFDRTGHCVGTSTPHQRATPIPTRRGRTRTKLDRHIRQRARALRTAMPSGGDATGRGRRPGAASPRTSTALRA